MVTYDHKTKAFKSKFNSFSITTVSPDMIYGWVKSGELNKAGFQAWIDYLQTLIDN